MLRASLGSFNEHIGATLIIVCALGLVASLWLTIAVFVYCIALALRKRIAKRQTTTKLLLLLLLNLSSSRRKLLAKSNNWNNPTKLVSIETDTFRLCRGSLTLCYFLAMIVSVFVPSSHC